MRHSTRARSRLRVGRRSINKWSDAEAKQDTDSSKRGTGPRNDPSNTRRVRVYMYRRRRCSSAAGRFFANWQLRARVYDSVLQLLFCGDKDNGVAVGSTMTRRRRRRSRGLRFRSDGVATLTAGVINGVLKRSGVAPGVYE